MQLRYRFTFDDGSERVFDVVLDDATLALQPPARPAPAPAWAALDNERCPNCPLQADVSPQCPAAMAVDPVIAAFHRQISHHEVLVSIETKERTVSRRAPVSTGISALIGLLMSTSGCPVLGKMRPMARTHLPFATLDETIYRAASMYLLAQYVVAQRGGAPDWSLDGLAAVYREVHTVNKAFLKRLRTLQIEDASLNAVVGLDCFATFTTMTVQAGRGDALADLSALFSAYLSGIPPSP